MILNAIDSFTKIVDNLEDAEKWLHSLDIDTVNTRFEKIKMSARKLMLEEEKKLIGKRYDFKKLGKDSSNLIYEITPFLNIFNFLKSVRDKDFIYTLKHIVDGPMSSLDEDRDTNVHRNHLFGLSLAAQLVNKGIIVKNFEDIVFELDNYEIAVQCKRPMYGNALQKNINSAYRQLESNNGIGKRNIRGIISVSVDKILKLDTVIEDYDTRDTLVKDILNKAERIQNEYGSIWRKFYNKDALGIIFYFRFPAYIKSENHLLNIVNFATLEPLKDFKKKSSEFVIWEKIIELFK